MTEPGNAHFKCPNCGAGYKVMRVEAPPGLGDDPISCVSCGAAIPSYDGKLAMKYFQIERSPRHRHAARSAWGAAQRVLLAFVTATILARYCRLM